jgi:hypothetical protein
MDDTELLDKTTNLKRRRDLLPWWIKVFCWIFMVAGIAAAVGLVIGGMGYPFQVSVYGLQTFDPLSPIGLFLIGIFLYKALTGLMLWMEKDSAIVLGQIDAISAIAICAFAMIYPLLDARPGAMISIRLELALIIPYLVKLNRIKKDWKTSGVKTV